MCYKGKVGAMSVYMSSYGVWRFFAEFLRADDRGSTVVDFLSPSQLTSILLIAGSVAVLLYSLYSKKKASFMDTIEKAENNEE
jgi:prolipoprotein diacylglyceryltransferase